MNNTGNPIPSTSALDFEDNLENLDRTINSPAVTYTDRLGVSRKSWAGFEVDFAAFLAASGFETPVLTYTDGVPLQVDRPTQLLERASDPGTLYSIKLPSSFPVILSGTWATDLPLMVIRVDSSLRDDLSATDGADIIGWRGDTVGEFLDGGWFQPNDLDVTGVADESAKVLAYLTTHKRVRLPATGAGEFIRLALIDMPSGTALSGYGAKDWSGASWQGSGTLVVGNIRLGNSIGCALTLMSVDNFAAGGNAVSGIGPDTANHYVARINTRANNHGQLWEQNGADPVGDYGGNIRVEDCKHWGGPNGFVSKMRSVSFVRCESYDTTVQSFVIVSDNINGASVYSRASNTKLIDCYADGGIAAIRIYSRDQFSLSNANGVLGSVNTEITGFRHGVQTQFVVRTGDSAGEATSGSYSRILNADVNIDARLIGHAGAGPALYLEMLNRGKLRVLFANNTAANFSAADQVFGVDRSGFYSSASFKPQEALTRINGVNSSTIDLTARPKIIRFQNTSATIISTVVGLTGESWFDFDCIIEENFTRLNIFGGLIYGKRGSVISVAWDGTSFSVVGVKSIYNDAEVMVAASATPSFDYWANRTRKISVFPTVSVTSVTLTNPSNLANGETYFLRIGSGSGVSIAISGWSSDFVWSASVPAPASTGSGGRMITFIALGSKLYAESLVSY